MSTKYGEPIDSAITLAFDAVGDGDCGFHAAYAGQIITRETYQRVNAPISMPRCQLIECKKQTVLNALKYIKESFLGERNYYVLEDDSHFLNNMFGYVAFLRESMCERVSRHRSSALCPYMERPDWWTVQVPVEVMNEYILDTQSRLYAFSTLQLLHFMAIDKRVRVFVDVDNTGAQYQELIGLARLDLPTEAGEVIIRFTEIPDMDGGRVGHYDCLKFIEDLIPDTDSSSNSSSTSSSEDSDEEDNSDEEELSDQFGNANDFPAYSETLVLNKVDILEYNSIARGERDPFKRKILECLIKQTNGVLEKARAYAQEKWAFLMRHYKYPRRGLLVNEIMDYKEGIAGAVRNTSSLSTPVFREVVLKSC